MNGPRPGRLWPDGAIAVLAVAAATAPAWRMGWLRDDWLLLWRALDPATAPAGAAGVFSRPVAGLLWNAAARLGGDAPWSMHLLVALCWVALVAGTLRWHRHFGGGTAGAVVAALALAGHGALVEPRLWAAAGNGVLAGALGVWGAWRLHAGPGPAGRGAGALLLVLAVLARADALVLLVLPAVAGSRQGRAVGLPLLALAVAGAAALAWMVTGGGGWAYRPADGGHLLRLLVLPWGPPLPAAAAAVAGTAAILPCLAGGWLLVRAAPRTAACLLAAAMVAVAGSLVDWTAAGRYVLMPAVTLALALAGWWEGGGGTRRFGTGRGLRVLVVAWLAVAALAVVRGRTAAELQAISAAETALYRAVRAALPLPADRLTVLDAPPLGWSGEAGDAENVVSAAARRPVTVVLAGTPPPDLAFPAAAWRDGTWIVWTGREELTAP